MPARGYLVGYLRSYSTAVGLDPDDVVLRYQEAAGLEDPEPAAPRPGLAAPRRRWVLVAAVVGLAVAAAVAIGFRQGGRAGGEIHGRKTSERAPYRTPGAP
jgi:cytoskeletal protein RodZ